MPFLTGHVWLLAIVLVIVLIIWGPGKLPDVGSGMGRAIREFRKASSDTRNELSSKATHADTAAPPTVRPEPPAPAEVSPPPLPAPPSPYHPVPLGGPSGAAPGSPPAHDPR